MSASCPFCQVIWDEVRKSVEKSLKEQSVPLNEQRIQDLTEFGVGQLAKYLLSWDFVVMKGGKQQ